MSIENQELRSEKNPMEVLADKLDELQREKNEGRGISCVQTLVMYLRMKDINQARAVCFSEGDKIRNYPDIQKLIKTELFQSKNHPWEIEEGWRGDSPHK